MHLLSHLKWHHKNPSEAAICSKPSSLKYLRKITHWEYQRIQEIITNSWKLNLWHISMKRRPGCLMMIVLLDKMKMANFKSSLKTTMPRSEKLLTRYSSKVKLSAMNKRSSLRLWEWMVFRPQIFLNRWTSKTIWKAYSKPEKVLDKAVHSSSSPRITSSWSKPWEGQRRKSYWACLMIWYSILEKPIMKVCWPKYMVFLL